MRDSRNTELNEMTMFSQKYEDSSSSLYSSVKCTKISDSRNEVKADVIIEDNIKLYLNDSHITTFIASPNELMELAVGYLICEGFIKSSNDLVSIKIEEDLIECVSKECNNHLDNPLSDVSFDKEDIFSAISYINQEAKLWKLTGGTHSSIVLSSKGEIISFCEDISRSCSVDKAIGKADLKGVDLSQCGLITTGRVSVTIVSKALNAGLPLIASKAAPVREGIMLAREKGATLVAFARKPNIYIYSADERIF